MNTDKSRENTKGGQTGPTFAELEEKINKNESEKKLLAFYDNVDIRLKQELRSLWSQCSILFIYVRLVLSNDLVFLLETREEPIIRSQASFKPNSRFEIYKEDIEQCNGTITYQGKPHNVKAFEKQITFNRNGQEFIGRQGVAFTLKQDCENLSSNDIEKIVEFFLKADLSCSLVPPEMLDNQKIESLNKIENIFEESLLLKKDQGDEWTTKGKEGFREKIIHFVSRCLPIIFIFPGFLFKSPNKDKTAGHLPDKGEELTLTSLANFCKKIEGVYPPGAKILIHRDSHYADIFIAPEDRSKVVEYLNGLKAMLEKGGYDKYISFHDLSKYFDTDQYSIIKMNNLFDIFCDGLETLDSINKKITNDKTIKKKKKEFNDLKCFIYKDIKFLNKYENGKDSIVSLSQLKDLLVETTVKLYYRYKSADRFLRFNMKPFAIRLNIQLKSNSGPSFSTCPVPGRDANGKLIPRAPWHGHCVQDENGSYYIGHYCDAQKLNMKSRREEYLEMTTR